MPDNLMIREEYLYRFIGQNIREYRSRLDISQNDLARAVGVQRTSISHIETGKKRPTVHMLYAMAYALNVEITDLLPEKKAVLYGLTQAETPYGNLEDVPLSVQELISDYYNSEDEGANEP